MKRVIYIHTNIYHPTHAAYARAVNADFLQYDQYCRFEDREVNFRSLRKYLSYLLLIFRFRYKKYDVILTDEPNIIPCLIKKISFNRIKLVATQASNTPYYYLKNTISESSKKIFRYAARNYDAIICIGNVQFREMKKITGSDANLYITFNGVAEDRYRQYTRFSYNPHSKKVFSLCHLFNKEIFENKGVDIMLKAMAEINKDFHLVYEYLGRSSAKDREAFLAEHQLLGQEHVFIGDQPNPAAWFETSLLMLHLSRIDAFPITICESFAAGMPVFITDDIGSRMLFDTMDNRDDYIVPANNVGEAVKKIRKYLSLSAEEKIRESGKFRSIAENFTETKACDNYRRIFLGALGK